MIKRIMLLLTVVLVMAAMMVASAMPAFARGPGGCPTPGTEVHDTSPQEFGQGVEGAVPIAFGTINQEPFPTGVADICTPSSNTAEPL